MKKNTLLNFLCLTLSSFTVFGQTQNLDWDVTAYSSSAITMSPGPVTATISTTNLASSSPLVSNAINATYPNSVSGSDPAAFGSGNTLGLTADDANLPSVITITFSEEVSNLHFSIFDIDFSGRISFGAVNGTSVDQPMELHSLRNSTGGISLVTGSTLTSPVNETAILNPIIQGPANAWAPSAESQTRRAGLNVSIAGPVKIVTIIVESVSNAGYDKIIYLSDILTQTTVLPVKLISFTASESENAVVLQWKTADEVDMSGYGIERSTDAKSFEQIIFLESSNMVNNKEWNYRDQTAVQDLMYYYRLKMVNSDGTSAYSTIRSVMVGDAQKKLVLFPNPATTKVSVFLPGYLQKGKLNFALRSGEGKLLFSGNTQVDGEILPLDNLVSDLRSGTYFLEVSNVYNKPKNIRFVIP